MHSRVLQAADCSSLSFVFLFRLPLFASLLVFFSGCIASSDLRFAAVWVYPSSHLLYPIIPQHRSVNSNRVVPLLCLRWHPYCSVFRQSLLTCCRCRLRCPSPFVSPFAGYFSSLAVFSPTWPSTSVDCATARTIIIWTWLAYSRRRVKHGTSPQKFS